jgi:exosortase
MNRRVTTATSGAPIEGPSPLAGPRGLALHTSPYTRPLGPRGLALHTSPYTRPLGAGASVGLALATALLLAPILAHAVQVWSTAEEFSYGFFVPLVAGALIWWRRDALRVSAGPGASAGLLIAAGAVGVILLARRAGINALAGVAVSPLLWGMAVFLWGWGTGRVLAFPLAFLVFGLGVYRGLLGTLGFALQETTAGGAAAVGRLLGLAIARDGLIIRAEGFAFVVAEQCSGLSSLLALLALAALWGYLMRGGAPVRLALLASVVPLVVIANVARVTLVLLVAAWYGQAAALGFFHGASSLALFAMALGGMFVVSRGLRRWDGTRPEADLGVGAR